MKTSQTWFILLISGIACGCLLADDATLVGSACDLKGICKFSDTVMYLNIETRGKMRMTDENGKSLSLIRDGETLCLRRPNGAKEVSVSGSPEEHCLLSALKKSFASPATSETPNGAEKSRYWVRVTAEMFIKFLERRCNSESGSNADQ